MNTNILSRAVIEKARCDMAVLFRLLARFDLNEGIDNHCSYALPDGSILVNKWGIHWSRMKRRDILRFDAQGNILDGAGTIETTAFHIHEAIHRLCPHAKAVLHTHMPYATAITSMENGRLEPISQNALRYYNKIAYEDTYNGLVDNPLEGERLARNIGQKSVVMMANHGVMVVGSTIGIAFNDMYFLERAAMVQVLAASGGKPFRKIPQEVIERTAAQMDGLDDDKETHFQTLKSILDELEPDYKD